MQQLLKKNIASNDKVLKAFKKHGKLMKKVLKALNKNKRKKK